MSDSVPAWLLGYFESLTGSGTSTMSADVSLTVGIDNFSVGVGGTVTFTVTASNLGPDAASGLGVNLGIGNGLVVTSVTPSAGSYQGGIWNVGSLGSAAAASLTVVATVQQSGWTALTATVGADNTSDPNVSNNGAAAAVFGLPASLGSQINAVVTTSGSVAAPVGGVTNVEVIANSTPLTALLAEGYNAAILVGGAAQLVDTQFGDALLAASGNDTLMTAANNDTLMATGGGNALISFKAAAFLSDAGQSAGNLFFGGSAPVTVEGGSGQDTVILTSGGVVTTGTGGEQVWLGAGNATVQSNGADTIVAGSGATTINALGSPGDLVFGGSGATRFNGGSGVSTVVGLNGSVTVNGGSGGGLFLGGIAGNNLINSGTGQATMIGGGSGDVLNASGSASDVLVASSGNETLNAGNSSGNDAFFGGAGSDCMVGGAGQNAFTAGSGQMTMVGGGSANLYAFLDGATSTTTIRNFNAATDFVKLQGYASGTAASAVAHETVSGGSTTISLPGGTTVTFAGVTNLSSASFI